LAYDDIKLLVAASLKQGKIMNWKGRNRSRPNSGNTFACKNWRNPRKISARL